MIYVHELGKMFVPHKKRGSVREHLRGEIAKIATIVGEYPDKIAKQIRFQACLRHPASGAVDVLFTRNFRPDEPDS